MHLGIKVSSTYMNIPHMLPEVRGGIKGLITNVTEKNLLLNDNTKRPLVQSELNNPFTKVTVKATY